MLINDNYIFNQNSRANINLNMLEMDNFNNNFMLNPNILPNANNMNNNEITLIIKFTTGLSFSIRCNINEKLSEVIIRFKKENNIKDELNFPISKANILKTDKTLLELGVDDKQVIMFVIKIEEEIKKIEKIYKLTKDEIIQIKKWFVEYEVSQILNIDIDVQFRKVLIINIRIPIFKLLMT